MTGLKLRLRITHRIAAIGAMGVLGVLTIGGIYLVGAAQQGEFRTAAEREKTMATRTGGFYLNMLESRRSEKDFFLRSDLKYAVRVAELGRVIDAELGALAGQATDPELAKRFTTVRDGFKKYLTHFTA